jgi:hypothetical protein
LLNRSVSFENMQNYRNSSNQLFSYGLHNINSESPDSPATWPICWEIETEHRMKWPQISPASPERESEGTKPIFQKRKLFRK